MSETQYQAGPAIAMAVPALPPRLAAALPTAVRAELARLPAAKQEAFIRAYRVRSKSLLLAYLTSLLYCHYALLGRWAMCGMMLLSLVVAAALGWIWWAIDLVRMPQMVREYNDRLAVDILRALEAPADPARLAGA